MSSGAVETGGIAPSGRVLSRVEQRGIEPVPDSQRNGSPGELFWVWFAANISILGIPLGALSLGLNFVQAIIVAVIGSLCRLPLSELFRSRGGAWHPPSPCRGPFMACAETCSHTGGPYLAPRWRRSTP